jgi:DNA polymerase III epsilon subunit-like protein
MKKLYFDLETNGYKGCDKYSQRHKIIQIAVLEDASDDYITAYVNPGVKILPESTKIHGITEEDVRSAPKFKEVWLDIVKKYKIRQNDVCLIAHNCFGFDKVILVKELRDAGFDLKDYETLYFIDSLVYFRNYLNDDLKKQIHDSTTGYSKYNLNNLHKFFFKNNIDNAHDALGDVIALKKICKVCKIDWTSSCEVLSIDEFSRFNGDSINSLYGIGNHRAKLIKKFLGDDVERIGDFKNKFDDIEACEFFLRSKLKIIEDDVVLVLLSVVFGVNPFSLIDSGYPFVRFYYGRFGGEIPGYQFTTIHKLIEDSLFIKLKLGEKHARALKAYTHF